MNKALAKALLITTLLCGWNGAVMAYQTLDARPQGRPIPSANALTETEPTLAPFAFVKFCLTYQAQCADAAPVRSIALDAKSWEELQRVNRQINDTIAPDAAKGGLDWSLETRLGNCNDYAVQKRDALIRMGYPMTALSLAVVTTPFGEGHLVLTVRTDRGDFVLDNRRTIIVAWNRTGYGWLKRQSAEDPQRWVALQATPAARGPQPASRLPMVARVASEPQGHIAVALADGAMNAETVAVAFPPVGLTVRVSDAAVAAPFRTQTGEADVTISHIAAGRQLAMLAFDDLGGWAIRPPLSAAAS